MRSRWVDIGQVLFQLAKKERGQYRAILTEQTWSIIIYYMAFGEILLAGYSFIVWLAPRAGKMNQIASCDWLPERARWSHLARSVHKHAKKELGQYPAILTSHLVNSPYILSLLANFILVIFVSLFTVVC